MKNLNSVVEELSTNLRGLGLNIMAARLPELVRSPEYLEMDKISFVEKLISDEYAEKTTKLTNTHLRNANLFGSDADISKCSDSIERRYHPANFVPVVSTLNFIADGRNICILGASGSGKTYLAKAIGAAACVRYRVLYQHCQSLLEEMTWLKEHDFPKYTRKIRHLIRMPLLILDDFLLYPMPASSQAKVLFDLLEERETAGHSTIVCSQRDVEQWPSMFGNDPVTAKAVANRVTRHYTILVESLK